MDTQPRPAPTPPPAPATTAPALGTPPPPPPAPGRHQPAEGERVPAPPADILQQPGRDLQCRVQPDHLQLLDSDQHQENIPNCPSIDFLAPRALPHFSPKFCYFLMNRHQSNSLSLVRFFQF